MLTHFFSKLKTLFTKKNCARFLIFLIPVIIALVLIGPTLWGGKVFLDSAYTTSQYSILFSQKDSLNSGAWFPVWISQWTSGFSLWLLPSSFGLLNPLHIILIKFLDFALAFHILTLIYWVAGFYAAYFLGRALNLSGAASVIVALAYTFNGYNMLFGHLLSLSFLYFLMPFLFLALLKVYPERGREGTQRASASYGIYQGERKFILNEAARAHSVPLPRTGFIFWSALFIFLAWPFALTQIFLYLLVATLAFALYLDFARRKPPTTLGLPKVVGGKEGLIPKRWLAVKSFFYFIIPGTFLALIWLVPIYNFLQLSWRAGGLSLEAAGNGRLLPWDIIFAYVYPSFYIPRIIRESFLYIGILPFILAVFALGNFKKDRMVRFFSIGYIFILAALFFNSPVWKLFNLIPVLNLFREPWHLLFVGNFFLAILAGFGLDALSTNKPGSRSSEGGEAAKDVSELSLPGKFFKNYIRGLKIVIFLGLAAALATALVIKFYRVALQNFAYNYFIENLLQYTKNRPLEHYYTLINGYFDKFSWYVSFSNPYFLTVLFTLGAVYILFYFYRRDKLTFNNFKIIAVIIIAADLLFVWRGHYKFMPRDWLNPVPAAVFLNSKDAGPFRIYNVQEGYFELEKMGHDFSDPKKDMLFQRSRMLGFGLNGVSGVTSEITMLDTRRYTKIMGAITKPDEAGVSRPEDLSTADRIKAWQSPRNRNLLSMMNVKYINSSFNFGLPWKKVFETKPVEDENIMTYVYENTEVLPRVYFANNASFVEPDEARAFDAFLAIKNFKNTTLIECETCADSGQPNFKDSLEIIKNDPGHITIKTQTKNPRYLVYSESNLPYWEARVDGKMSRVYMANYTYLAVLVPSGEHLVEFQYPGPITQFKYALRNLIKTKLTRFSP